MRWITDFFQIWSLGNLALTMIGVICDSFLKRNIERRSCSWKLIVTAQCWWILLSLYISWKQLFKGYILFQFAAFVWIGGLLGRSTDYAFFRFRLYKIRMKSIYDDALNSVLNTYKIKFHTKRNIHIYRSTATKEGIVFGIANPVVVIPMEMNDKSAEMIICHELTHIVNNDLMTAGLTQAIVLLGWMNPFVPLLKEKAEKACELKCHLDVCKMKDKEFTNKDYFKLICQEPG